MSGFFTSSDEPVALKAPPHRVTAENAAPRLPRAAVPTSTSVTHRYGNTALNGRLTAHLPEGVWNVRWQADLEPGMNPAAVLNGWDRELVWGWGGWQLFDPAGKSLASGLLDSADVLLDEHSPTFYLVDAATGFTARHAQNGTVAFSLEAPSPRQLQITYLARYQQQLLASASSRPPQPHAYFKPHTSVIQSHRLEPMSASVEREWTRDVAEVLTAVSNNTLAIATTKHIYLAGVELDLRGAIEGDFEPLAMSLDETGRLYLIVRDNRGQALWVLTPEGALVSYFRFPAGTRAGTVPPLISYSHNVFVLASGKLFAIGPAGRLLWELAVSEAAQAAITADDELLLANGAELIRVSPEGQRLSLHRFKDWLRTVPILTPQGELIAVTEEQIYCLSTKALRH